MKKLFSSGCPPPLPPPLPTPTDENQLCSMVVPDCQRRSNCMKSPQMEPSTVCQRRFDNDRFDNENYHLLSYNRNLSPVLQEGPSCGLTALCMAAQLVDDWGTKPKLPEVLEKAKSLGFTNRGEMFSAINVCSLAKEVIKCCETELLTDGFDQKAKIVSHLGAGRPVLVPYDADMNHEPTCRRGHNAHWAVLTGVVFIRRNDEKVLMPSFERDVLFPPLYHASDLHRDHCLRLLTSNEFDDGNDEIYVYARQGKSCHLGLWSYDSLAKSNANLIELSPLRRRSFDGYVLPVDGVEGGLCRQVVLLKRKVPT